MDVHHHVVVHVKVLVVMVLEVVAVDVVHHVHLLVVHHVLKAVDLTALVHVVQRVEIRVDQNVLQYV